MPKWKRNEHGESSKHVERWPTWAALDAYVVCRCCEICWWAGIGGFSGCLQVNREINCSRHTRSLCRIHAVESFSVGIFFHSLPAIRCCCICLWFDWFSVVVAFIIGGKQVSLSDYFELTLTRNRIENDKETWNYQQQRNNIVFHIHVCVFWFTCRAARL